MRPFLFLVVSFLLCSVAAAQSPEPGGEPPAAFADGDAAVSGFSGIILSSPTLPPGVNPIDRTFIDLNGASLRVFDLSNVGGDEKGEILQPVVKLEVRARDIGQVFGLAFDEGIAGGPPNLYAAATSAFGLAIVGAIDPDDKPARLKAGAPDARFMEGQFGGLEGANPGTIFKIDGVTGKPSVFASTSSGNSANSGAGIGGLAIEPASRSLFASDLDTGVIHRFALNDGTNTLSSFDHGAAGRQAQNLPPIPDDQTRLNLVSSSFKPDDSSTWGLTQPERRIHGLAVHNGRLYYSVAAGPSGPEIWSVGLVEGDFGPDARLETVVKAERPVPITGIAFDGSGHMFLAQRGTQKGPYDFWQFTDGGGQVLRYDPKPSDTSGMAETWVREPQTVAIGMQSGTHTGSGGVSLQFAYTPDGKIDLSVCDQRLVVTGDALRGVGSASIEASPAAPMVHGLQMRATSTSGASDMPAQDSVFIAFNPAQSASDASGHVGNVAVLRRCGGNSGFPPIAAAGDGFPPVDGGGSGGFPPVEGGGGNGSPPVVGGGGGTGFPPVEGGGAGVGEGFPPVTDAGGGGAGSGFPPVEGAEGVLKIEKKATAAACSVANGGCPFEITIANTGTMDVAGPIEVKDELTQIGGQQGGTPSMTTLPPAPWTCTTTHPFVCTHPGPVAAGQILSLKLATAPGDTKTTKEVQNCASLTTAGPAPAQPPPAKQLKTLEPTDVPILPPLTPPSGSTASDDAAARAAASVSKTICRGYGPDRVCINIYDNDAAFVRFSFRALTPATHFNLRQGARQWEAVVNGQVPRGTDVDIQRCSKGTYDLSSSCGYWQRFKLSNVTSCEQYAETAVNDAFSNLGCSFTGPRWDTVPNNHFNWCMEASEDGPAGPAAETEARRVESMKCSESQSMCSLYSQQAVGISRMSEDLECGFVGPRWSTDPQSHLKWCSDMNGNTGAAKDAKNLGPLGAEWKAREEAFLQCRKKRFASQAGPGIPVIPVTASPTPQPGSPACATIPFQPAPADQTGPVQPPPGQPPPLVPPVAEADLPPVAGADGPTQNTPYIVVQKTLFSADCVLGKMCQWQIRITNAGTAPYNGKIAIIDSVISGATGANPGRVTFSTAVNSRWICSGADEEERTLVRCDLGQVTIAPGASELVDINTKTGPSWAKDNILKNCALLLHDKASNEPPSAGKDPLKESCATVRLDPFALKITKSGAQSCKPGGECRFDLDIFNPGPILHDDPVTVVDGLSGLDRAQIVSITTEGASKPFPCSPGPTQIPFSCTGHMKLEIGERHKYTIIIRLPQSVSASSFKNCAILSSPKAQTAVGKTDAEARSLAARVGGPNSESSDCHEVSLSPTTVETQPAPAQCFGGMVMTPAGSCICPDGSSWNGRTCVASATPADGGGYDTSRPPVPTKPEKSAVCAPTMIGKPPNCRCPQGTSFVDGACRAPKSSKSKVEETCPVSRPVGSPPNCCPRGTEYRRGKCRSVEAEAPKKVPRPVETCPVSRPVGDPPNCCPLGTEYRRGKCRSMPTEPPSKKPPPPIETCPVSRPVGKYPNCCPLGTFYLKGACVRPQQKDPERQQCPPGKIMIGGKCRSIPQRETPPVQQDGGIKVVPKQDGPIFKPKQDNGGIKVIPKQDGPILRTCPKGLGGPKCDQPVVN